MLSLFTILLIYDFLQNKKNDLIVLSFAILLKEKKTELFFGNTKKENTFAVPFIVHACKCCKILIPLG